MKSCSLGWHWGQIFTENFTISYSGIWNVSSKQREKAVIYTVTRLLRNTKYK